MLVPAESRGLFVLARGPIRGIEAEEYEPQAGCHFGNQDGKPRRRENRSISWNNQVRKTQHRHKERGKDSKYGQDARDKPGPKQQEKNRMDPAERRLR